MDSMNDGGIKWGAEIAVVDGKRPEFLVQQDVKRMLIVFPGGFERKPVDDCDPLEEWGWSSILAIRLPANHPHYQKQAEAPAIDPALVERMVALVRAAAEGQHIEAGRARDILKALEQDSDLLEAREIAKPWLIYDGAYSIDNGYCDDQPAMKAVLAAIRRGRQLERGEK